MRSPEDEEALLPVRRRGLCASWEGEWLHSDDGRSSAGGLQRREAPLPVNGRPGLAGSPAPRRLNGSCAVGTGDADLVAGAVGAIGPRPAEARAAVRVRVDGTALRLRVELRCERLDVERVEVESELLHDRSLRSAWTGGCATGGARHFSAATVMPCELRSCPAAPAAHPERSEGY